MRVSWLRKAVGYRGAGLPFHSSCQGLAGLAGTRSQPGPAAPAPARPLRGMLGSIFPENRRGILERRGARAARAEGTGAQALGKGLRLQSSCQAPADPALAAAPRPPPHTRNRSPDSCGALLPRALTPSSVWVPALTKIMDFISSPEKGDCFPPELAQPWLWAGLGWKSHWL